MNRDSEHLKKLATQLSCPQNEEGIEVANMMHDSNIGMTRKTITALNIAKGDLILELGHGNCKHLSEILTGAENISYYGLEISELMKNEAAENNIAAIQGNQASFHLYDGKKIPFSENTFDKILTVNTIYFWENPETFIQEIYRVLKPNGLFAIGFADKNFMETLPFTSYGFNLYHKEKLNSLIGTTRFNMVDTYSFTETVKTKVGDEVERLFYVSLVQK